VTLVFQNFALLPWLNVAANVQVGLDARAEPIAKRRQQARQAFDRIGLTGVESAFPRELSGGMCQRVDFVRALVEPDVLLMDEPFSALDVLTGANLLADLLDLWASTDFPTKATLMGTHNIEEAVQMADRIHAYSPRGRAARPRPSRTYSGGLRRRLDLAAALVHHPAQGACLAWCDVPDTQDLQDIRGLRG